MNEHDGENLRRLEDLSSELSSVEQDMVKVEGAGLPTAELEQRAAGLILELIELNPDLTPIDKATIKKEIERHGINKIFTDLGKFYNE